MEDGIFGFAIGMAEIRAEPQARIAQGRIFAGQLWNQRTLVEMVKIEGDRLSRAVFDLPDLDRSGEVEAGGEEIDVVRFLGSGPKCVFFLEADVAVLVISEIEPIFGHVCAAEKSAVGQIAGPFKNGFAAERLCRGRRGHRRRKDKSGGVGKEGASGQGHDFLFRQGWDLNQLAGLRPI